MPVTHRESSLTSIVPSHFNRLIQGMMYLRRGRGGRLGLKETVSIRVSINVEGWTWKKEDLGK